MYRHTTELEKFKELDPHYSMMQNENFLSDQFVLSLSPESKELFALGKPGQGYIGLVDLETGILYLVPSFNENDGLERTDLNGQPFKSNQYIIGSAPLGQLGRAHTIACEQIEALKEKIKTRTQGKILGFGIWKAGYSIKFVKEMPERAGLIPNEYILIENESGYQIVYIDADRNKHRLNDLENVLKGQEIKNRLDLEAFIHTHHQNNSFDVYHPVGIKFVKNRSTVLNSNAIKYSQAYSLYFHANNKGHTAHSNDLIRELPLNVFQKIMNCVFNSLGVPSNNLLDNPIIPKGIDGIDGHLFIENRWKTKSAYVFLEYSFLTQNKHAIDSLYRESWSFSSLKHILEYALLNLDKPIIDFFKEIDVQLPHPYVPKSEHEVLMRELFSILLSYGERLSTNDEFLQFALQSCDRLCNPEDLDNYCSWLIQNGEVSHSKIITALAVKTKKINESVLAAVSAKKTEIASELLKTGIDPNNVNQDISLLNLAFSHEMNEVVDSILSNPTLLPETLEHIIFSLLQIQNPSGNHLNYLLRILEHSLSASINLNKIHNGNYSLHHAIINNWPKKSIKLLCKHGADMSKKNPYFSAYDLAFYEPNLKLSQEKLEKYIRLSEHFHTVGLFKNESRKRILENPEENLNKRAHVR